MKDIGERVTSCAAINCQVTEENISDKTEFYNFPHDNIRCKLWVHLCRRLDLFALDVRTLNFNYKLCKKHFKDCMFQESNKTKLKINAIPTLFDFPKVFFSEPVLQLNDSEVASVPQTVAGEVKYETVTTVMCCQGGKLFISGGPLLEQGKPLCPTAGDTIIIPAVTLKEGSPTSVQEVPVRSCYLNEVGWESEAWLHWKQHEEMCSKEKCEFQEVIVEESLKMCNSAETPRGLSVEEGMLQHSNSEKPCRHSFTKKQVDTMQCLIGTEQSKKTVLSKNPKNVLLFSKRVSARVKDKQNEINYEKQKSQKNEGDIENYFDKSFETEDIEFEEERSERSAFLKSLGIKDRENINKTNQKSKMVETLKVKSVFKPKITDSIKNLIKTYNSQELKVVMLKNKNRSKKGFTNRFKKTYKTSIPHACDEIDSEDEDDNCDTIPFSDVDSDLTKQIPENASKCSNSTKKGLLEVLEAPEEVVVDLSKKESYKCISYNKLKKEADSDLFPDNCKIVNNRLIVDLSDEPDSDSIKDSITQLLIKHKDHRQLEAIISGRTIRATRKFIKIPVNKSKDSIVNIPITKSIYDDVDPPTIVLNESSFTENSEKIERPHFDEIIKDQSEIPDNVKEIIKSYAPQGKKVLVIKEKGRNKPMVIKRSTYSQTENNVVSNCEKTRSILDPPIQGAEKPCYCNGLPYIVLDKSFMTPEHKALAEKYLQLKSSFDKLKRSNFCLKQMMQNPPKIKLSRLLEELKKMLSGDSYTLIETHLRRSVRHLKSRGVRFSEELKLLASKLMLAGPRVYRAFAHIFTLPSKVSLQRWIVAQEQKALTSMFPDQNPAFGEPHLETMGLNKTKDVIIEGHQVTLCKTVPSKNFIIENQLIHNEDIQEQIDNNYETEYIGKNDANCQESYIVQSHDETCIDDRTHLIREYEVNNGVQSHIITGDNGEHYIVEGQEVESYIVQHEVENDITNGYDIQEHIVEGVEAENYIVDHEMNAQVTGNENKIIYETSLQESEANTLEELAEAALMRDSHLNVIGEKVITFHHDDMEIQPIEIEIYPEEIGVIKEDMEVDTEMNTDYQNSDKIVIPVMDEMLTSEYEAR